MMISKQPTFTTLKEQGNNSLLLLYILDYQHTFYSNSIMLNKIKTHSHYNEIRVNPNCFQLNKVGHLYGWHQYTFMRD